VCTEDGDCSSAGGVCGSPIGGFCEGAGICLPNNEPCALVTSSSLCTFDVQPDKGFCVDDVIDGDPVGYGDACLFDTDCDAAGGVYCVNDGRCLDGGGNDLYPVVCDTDPAEACGGSTPGACMQTGQFRLVYTPDVKSFPAYKLPASNPGQTFYNVLAEGVPGSTVTVSMDIPYPYETVGGKPVHVYDAWDVVGQCADSSTGEQTEQACRWDDDCAEGEFCDASCFAPTAALQQFDIRWNIEDYFEICNGTTTGNCPPYDVSGGGINHPDVTCDDGSGGAVCGPGGTGSCTFDVHVVIPPSGQAYVNVHLDYGFKGPHVDANPCGGVCTGDGTTWCQSDDECVLAGGICQFADRYDRGDSSGTKFAEEGFDAWVNTDNGRVCSGDGQTPCTTDDNCTTAGGTCVTPPMGIADCSNYVFGHEIGLMSWADSVQNLNAFKPIAGAFGHVNNSQLNQGHSGLKLGLAKASSPSTILKTATTDPDGFYTLPYKHKGKPALYELCTYDETGAVTLGCIVFELQGNGWTQINFDSYGDPCGPEDAFCECNGWCASAEYGSGRQSDGGSGGDSGGGGGGDVCELAQKGDSCTLDSDCCSNNCKGKKGSQTCN
jgi:hypothetical protein